MKIHRDKPLAGLLWLVETVNQGVFRLDRYFPHYGQVGDSTYLSGRKLFLRFFTLSSKIFYSRKLMGL
jgi:hypothetical protein